MTAAILQEPGVRDFERHVRVALAALYDVPRLQIHPLARFVAMAPTAREPTAGRVLQRCLREAIDALRPQRDGAGERATRIHELLRLRYVEGLAASVVWQQLGIGKSEYHREHGRAIQAVASILRARWQLSTGPTRTPQSSSPVSVMRHLPRPLTRLIGRQPELAHIKQLVETERLVTLTGVGGCGKTRLAVELVLELAPALAEDVCFVDLAALHEAALVPQVILASIGAREMPGQPVLTALLAYLNPRSAVLVLDNCEHLIDACAHLVDSLLRACSGVHVLATSREPLGVGGEVTWRVPSLSFPDPHARPMSIAAVADYEAVRLFVDRARLVRRDFALTAANAQAVAQVCGQLDGIPLAIELAASRLNVLSADELLARLEDRFQLLTAGSRTDPPRHQALRATVDWSYQLLTEPERRLFGRLSVFAGGFTLAAAEDVVSGDGLNSAEVLELLAHLTDKSLVMSEEFDGRIRYRLLETLRRYANDRLRGSGEYEAARSRHLDYFVRLAEATDAHLGFFQSDAVMAEWLNRIEIEEDNLRAALEWSELRPDCAERGLRLAGSLHWFWFVRGRFTEARGRLERLLARDGAAPSVRLRALVAAGYLAFWKGDFIATPPLLAEGVRLARAVEEPAWAAFAQCGLGAAASGRGDHALAHAKLDAAVTAARGIDDRWVTAFALHFLAQCATNMGDVALAGSLLQVCIDMLDHLGGNKGGTAFSLLHLGGLARKRGDLLTARNRILDALRLFAELEDRRGIAYALVGLAGVTLAVGDAHAAAQLFGASDLLRSAGGPFLEETLRTDLDRDLAAVHAALGEDVFTAQWTAGRVKPLDQTIATALGTTSSVA